MKSTTKRLLLIFVVSFIAGIFTILMVLMIRGYLPVPQYLEVFGLQIRLYSITATIGVLTAVLLFERFSKQRKALKKLDVWEAGLVALIPGVVGSRIYHVITESHLYGGDLGAMLDIRNGGLGIIGGFILGGLALTIYLRRKQIDVFEALGLVVVFIPIAQIIGRLGNFFNRELFGFPTDLPWAMYISPLDNPIPFYAQFEYFHPIFLYESILNLVLAIVLFWLWKQKKHGSTLILMYISGYGLIRYIIDFFRVDGNSGLYFQDINLALSYAQIMILGWFVFAVGFGITYQVWHRSRYGVWFTDKQKLSKKK